MANKQLKKYRKIKRNSKLITYFMPKSPITEQYRRIRTSIQFAGLKDKARVILVTSPRPEEGKSTTAANLATVFTEQNNKVLLMDADLRKPSCHFLFHNNNSYGLTNLFYDADELNAVIQDTGIPNLDLMTSGPVPPNPAELLGLEEMEGILSKLKQVYDYLIIDSPPVLPVSDALILAQQCDGIILVACSGKTKKNQVVEARTLLENTGGKILGVIINRKKMRLKKDSYYYYEL